MRTRSGMPQRLPINGRDPTILGGVEMHHSVCQELVGLAVVRGVIGGQSQGQLTIEPHCLVVAHSVSPS